MRTLAVAALLVGTALGLNANNKPVVDKELVEKINNIPNLSWKASETNGIITGANLNEVMHLLGSKELTLPKDIAMREFTEEEMKLTVPDEFDSATNWPQCTTIPYIWDQSDCGSCWAVGAAGAISDRLCTAGTNKRVQLVSARDLLSCCTSCGFGCEGGYPSAAWSYWVNKGLVTEECQPYPFPKCDHHTTGQYPPCGQNEYPTPSCLKQCNGNSTGVNMTVIKGAKSYGVSGEDSFQRELMTNGPFEVSFTVYDDFLAYKSGVYTRTSSKRLGGHAVRLVGWGSLNGVKYWKIANSWNTDWAMEGYFLIKRGVNECGIEGSGNAGLPQ